MSQIPGSGDLPEWSRLDLEPPMEVTRVRSPDGRNIAIRGAQCQYEGPGHSHWAYILAGGKPRTPSADSSQEGAGGWECWLELDFTGRFKLIDDTANDDR